MRHANRGHPNSKRQPRARRRRCGCPLKFPGRRRRRCGQIAIDIPRCVRTSAQSKQEFALRLLIGCLNAADDLVDLTAKAPAPNVRPMYQTQDKKRGRLRQTGPYLRSLRACSGPVGFQCPSAQCGTMGSQRRAPCILKVYNTALKAVGKYIAAILGQTQGARG